MMDKQHVKAPADKAKGAIKDTAGKMVGDKNLQNEVKFDKAKGESDTHNLAASLRDAVKYAANHGQNVANDD
jgi:uncharacterized protein YjbJ (UPF0337 family)